MGGDAAAAHATVHEIAQELAELGHTGDAQFLQRYFKTGPGEYGDGDRFLGIRVPVLRRLARKYRQVELADCRALLRSPYHEARLLALLILVLKYERGDTDARAGVYRLYLDEIGHVDNWDLVDASAPHIVGRHLEQRDPAPLLELARSESVWQRRIAIVATHRLIKAGDFEWTFRIADLLLADRHDLIHKAVGWMLREVGKLDREAEEQYLRPRCRRMPRTMLRYAIERFPEPLRQQYLRGEVAGE